MIGKGREVLLNASLLTRKIDSKQSDDLYAWSNPLSGVPSTVAGTRAKGILLLFPSAGPDTSVVLPVGLLTNFLILCFSADGQAIYGQTNNPARSTGEILRIDLKSMRQSAVPGSAGFKTIWHMTVSLPPTRIFVSGCAHTSRIECGAFEIDPQSGTQKRLISGDLGPVQNLGPVCPDGRMIAVPIGKKLCLLNLETGLTRSKNTVASGMLSAAGTWISQCAWSPDSRWLVAVGDRRIALIDASEPVPPRYLGPGYWRIEWSPDSKYLLVRRPQLSCAPTLYGQSLEIIDRDTGKRVPVKGSHCRISGGAFGWVSLRAFERSHTQL